MRFGWVLFAGLLTTWACSSGSIPGSPDSGNAGDTGVVSDGADHAKDSASHGKDSAPVDTGAKPDVAMKVDAGFGPYPAGPYGVTVGSVIADMMWIGYVDDAANAVATTKPYVPYSLDDARRSGKHYAMINLAESDCPGCQKSAGEIEAGGASVVDAGGVVIEVLETTGFVAQASQADLEAWINKYMLTVTTVKDPDGTGTPTLNSLGQREQAYIIDLTTMTIIQIIEGDTSGIGMTSGGKALTAMHTLLGK
jgi:hypothetical protein